jgi:hypothetical protein
MPEQPFAALLQPDLIGNLQPGLLEGVELNFDKSLFDCIYMYVRRRGFRTLLSIILWENNYVF